MLQGRHALLELQEGVGVAPNSTYIAASSSCNIITGPNLSGKSTYLQQVRASSRAKFPAPLKGCSSTIQQWNKCCSSSSKQQQHQKQHFDAGREVDSARNFTSSAAAGYILVAHSARVQFSQTWLKSFPAAGAHSCSASSDVEMCPKTASQAAMNSNT
jgi:hypothetical protein